MTLLQIAIALASITVLTKKQWLLYGAGLSALLGMGVGVDRDQVGGVHRGVSGVQSSYEC